MQEINAVFYIIVLILSVVIHEVAHGYVAYRFGDNTAKNAGRLTMNPLKHIDPFGSILLPFLLILSNAGFVLGWAKPVPYDPDNFTKRRLGTGLVAFAGAASNMVLAIFFAIIIRVAIATGLATPALLSITSLIVLTNIGLAIFNLVPIPPLDGSRILFSLLPPRFAYYEHQLERFAIFILVAFVFLFSRYLSPLISYSFSLLTGLSL